MTQETLSTLNAVLIGSSGISLLIGWTFIRRWRRVQHHRRMMLAATGFAAAFLVSYVLRWTMYGSKPFLGEGIWRAVYLGILAPHIVMAVALGPLALFLIFLAARRRDFPRHKRWARVTLPIWLFVVASGWLVYAMLYRFPF